MKTLPAILIAATFAVCGVAQAATHAPAVASGSSASATSAHMMQVKAKHGKKHARHHRKAHKAAA